MAITIEELLRSIHKGEHTSKNFNPADIYRMLGDKKSFEEMGFSSKEELDKFLIENPYNNI